MACVVWCGVLFALARSAGVESFPAMLVFTSGPISGALIHRFWGGRGILGGMIGGIASHAGFGVVMYLWAYLYPEPGVVDYLGPGFTFFILTTYGAVFGLAAGVLIWAAMLIGGPRGKV
jgi:hypothetical protein